MNDSARFNPEDQASRILAAVVESSDDAIVVEDLDGVVLAWNRGAARLYGYSAQEIIGRSIAVLIPDSRPNEPADALGRIRAGDRVEAYETVGRTKDGRLVDVSVTASPIVDAAGHVVGAVSIARDVSARQRAEAARRDSDLAGERKFPGILHDLTERTRLEERLRASEARWRAVIESAVDGIVVIDATGAIEAFNPAAERLFGYTEREMLGRNVNLLMPSPYHEEHDQYIAQYLATGVQKIIGIGREVTGLRKDGTIFPVRLSVGEMNVGGDRKFTGILHDLSARVRMEEQLREQTALARLGEMAAVIAHEVKNPLAGVRGAVQVIGSRLPPESKDAQVAKEIVARIDGLNNLMKDLLRFARPPQPQPVAVDVAALVTSTAELFSDDPSVAGMQVRVEGSAPPIAADPELLKIVFVNLLMNAAHAMQGRGVVRVSVRSSDGSCSVAVHDSGPGIPPEIREKIFTPFFTTKSRGTGLGLPTAKRIVEAHAGRISVECPPSGGTTVTIQLPA